MGEVGRHKSFDASFLRVRLHPVTIAIVMVAVVLFGVLGILRLNGAATALGEEAGGAVIENAENDGYLPAPDSASTTVGGDQSGQASAIGPGYALSGYDKAGAQQADASQGEGAECVIYVTGAVNNPGVVRLPAGSRVVDAVNAAGGLSEGADLASFNLARIATDGEHIHILRPGEAPPAGLGGSASAGGTNAGATSSAGAAPGCVDLNTASESELQALDGVGPKLAERIATYRDQQGGFSNVEQLVEVPGIGQVLLGRISAGVCQ